MATFPRERMYPLWKEGSGAYTVNFPSDGSTVLSVVPGSTFKAAAGYAVKDEALVAADNALGVGEVTVGGTALALGTLFPITIAVPGQFWVGTFQGTYALADIPIVNGYATTVTAANSFATIDRATTAADNPCRPIGPVDRFGKATIRGNIIEKAGTTYGSGQTLTSTNYGPVAASDVDIRVVFVWNPNATIFG